MEGATASERYPSLAPPMFTVIPPSTPAVTRTHRRRDSFDHCIELPTQDDLEQEVERPLFFVNVAWTDQPKEPIGFLALTSHKILLKDAREALFEQIEELARHRYSRYDVEDANKTHVDVHFIRHGINVSPQQEEVLTLHDVLPSQHVKKTQATVPLILLRRVVRVNKRCRKNNLSFCCALFIGLLLMAFSLSLWQNAYERVLIGNDDTSNSVDEAVLIVDEQGEPVGMVTADSASNPNSPPWLRPVFELMDRILQTLIVLVSGYYRVLEYMFSTSNPVFQILPMMSEIMFWYFQTFQYCWDRMCDLIKFVTEKTLVAWPTVAILALGLQGICYWTYRMQRTCARDITKDIEADDGCQDSDDSDNEEEQKLK